MPTTIQIAPPSLAFADDVLHFELLGTSFTGTEDPYEPTEDNLSCYVQVWKKGTIEDEFLVELRAPFSLKNKRAFFDLSSALRLTTPPPNSGTLQGNIAVTTPGGDATYYLLHGQMFGSPALPESSLTQSSDYHVISGATRYLQGLPTANVHYLHSMVSSSGKRIIKEVTRDEPGLAYFYCKNAETCAVNVRLEYSVGFENVDLGTFNFFAGSINCLTVGWQQLRVEQFMIGSVSNLRYYIVQFTIDGTTYERYCHLDLRSPDNERYIAYSNGIGGVEILRCFGDETISTSVTKSAFVRPRTASPNYRTGSIGTLSSGGHDIYEVNTGYYSRDYIMHLRQLLVASAWLVDRDRGDYYAISILDDDLDIVSDGDDRYSLTIRYRTDEVPTFNTFNQ